MMSSSSNVMGASVRVTRCDVKREEEKEQKQDGRKGLPRLACPAEFRSYCDIVTIGARARARGYCTVACTECTVNFFVGHCFLTHEPGSSADSVRAEEQYLSE